MSGRRVVITGIGMISPIGSSKEEFWDNLIQGCSGVDYINRFDPTGFPVKIAAQVKDYDPQDYIPRKDARRMDKFVQYACSAALIALKDSGLTIDPLKASRIGVWIGSGVGGIETMEKNTAALLNKGVSGINPFFIPMLIPNMAAGQVSIMLGAKGPNGCTVTACASGTNSIGEAFRIIQHGGADVMISGGTEACITPLGMGGFCSMKALSTYNQDPERACRPFDISREGFVMGEGAAILVLEEYEYARNRGAEIYAEIIGFGCSADACHIVQPDEQGRGAILAFQAALQDAGISPEEVDYVNAHGTGTHLNDEVESLVIREVFGPYSSQLPVSSIKAATGHMLGAAGAIEIIASVLALKHQQIPPTLNLNHIDPACNLDHVSREARVGKLQTVLSDSLGFGGHNAVLIIRQVAER